MPSEIPTFEIPNYTLLSRLGKGAMADVWLAEHKRNGRKAAIKILKPSTLSEKDAEQLFLREGRVLAGFDHPNIVKIYDNDKIGDLAYLAMEVLKGGSLLERMQRGPITVGEALGLVTQMASALAVLHQQQVIHRDLKPANVMLRDETTPVLTDFGTVRLVDKTTYYGREGNIVGTFRYMSPEQMGGEKLSGASDLYSLGVIFYELLTGRLPFLGASIEAIAEQHFHAPVPQLPSAIHMLQPLIEKLLAKQAELRYPTAQAFIDALRATFVDHDALRHQVGFSGTSIAWTCQLRALGFVLDPAQKDQVRIEQGKYLQIAAAAPVTPLVQPIRPVRSGQSRHRWLIGGGAALLLLSVSVVLLWPRPSERFQGISSDTLHDLQTGLKWARSDNMQGFALIQTNQFLVLDRRA